MLFLCKASAVLGMFQQFYFFFIIIIGNGEFFFIQCIILTCVEQARQSFETNITSSVLDTLWENFLLRVQSTPRGPLGPRFFCSGEGR